MGFLRAHALLTRHLDLELRKARDMALSEFEVLLHLAWAGGEARMAQIAQDVVLTGGGVTRIVKRLERLGLIRRRSCPSDGRGVFAVLTEKGWSAQRSAQRIHLEGVRRLFLQETSRAELATLAGVFGRVVARESGRESNGAEACALQEKESPPSSRGRNQPS